MGRLGVSKLKICHPVAATGPKGVAQPTGEQGIRNANALAEAEAKPPKPTSPSNSKGLPPRICDGPEGRGAADNKGGPSRAD